MELGLNPDLKPTFEIPNAFYGSFFFFSFSSILYARAFTCQPLSMFVPNANFPGPNIPLSYFLPGFTVYVYISKVILIGCSPTLKNNPDDPRFTPLKCQLSLR